jgi:MOSC domain-containing protein YiiM
VDEEESRVRLLSVNVGLPRELEWRGRRVRTSIWKTPAEGRVRVTRLNLEGDEQSDLSVHGGPEKAVYAYPTEHYEYWGREFPGMDLPWGAFGENFTTEGLVKRFLRSGRPGLYLAVLREGEVGRGDPIEFTERDTHDVTVADISALYTHDADNQSLLHRAIEVAALPESLRDYFRKRLRAPDA